MPQAVRVSTYQRSGKGQLRLDSRFSGRQKNFESETHNRIDDGLLNPSPDGTFDTDGPVVFYLSPSLK